MTNFLQKAALSILASVGIASIAGGAAAAWSQVSGVAQFIARDRVDGSTYIVGNSSRTVYKWNGSGWDAKFSVSSNISATGNGLQVNNGIAYYTRIDGLGLPLVYSQAVISGTESNAYGSGGCCGTLYAQSIATSAGTGTPTVFITWSTSHVDLWVGNPAAGYWSEPNSSARATRITYDSYLSRWFVTDSGANIYFSSDTGATWNQVTGCATLIASDSDWVQGCDSGTTKNLYSYSTSGGGNGTYSLWGASIANAVAFTTNAPTTGEPTAPEFAIDSSGNIYHWQ